MAPGLLLLVLLAPAASAEAFATLDSVEVAVANAQLSGTLAGVAWLANPPAGTPLAPSGAVELPGFSLVAEHAIVTVHHVERYGANDLPPGPPTRWTVTNATAAGASGDAKDARLVAVPTSTGATLNVAGFQRLSAAATETRSFPTRVTGGMDSAISTGKALLVERGDDGLVELHGDFRLVVDGLDFVLGSDDGPRDVHTRSDIEGGELETPLGSYAAHSFVHEAVLDLTGAVLRLPASEAYVTEAAVSSQGPWAFRGASGRVETQAGPQQVAGYVELDGRVDGTLRRSDQRVAATLSGSVGGVVVDGQFTAIATAPASPPATLALAAAAAGGTVALLAAAHVLFGRWRFGRLDHAMDRADYRNALGLSRGFLGHPKLAQDAALAAAICMLALGRPDDARARLQARSEWTVRRRPMRDFLLARAQAALGRADEATRLLASSLVAEPSLLPQAQADPFLADILRGVRPRTASEEAYA